MANYFGIVEIFKRLSNSGKKTPDNPPKSPRHWSRDMPIPEEARKLRREIEEKASVEGRLITQYVDLVIDATREEFKEVLYTWESALTFFRIAKWIAGVGLAATAIWSFIASNGHSL